MEQKEQNKIKKILKIILFTLGILIILVALSIVIAYNTGTTSIKVILDKELSTEQEENIRKQLESICNTTDIEYVSEDEALQQMNDWLKEDSDLLDNYKGDNNIFPSSYIIKDVRFNKLSKITREVSEINGITKVNADGFYTKSKTFLLKNTKKESDGKDAEEVEYDGLTVSEVRDIVTNKVNLGKIYIDDVEKVLNIKSISLKETVDNIELWEMTIEYQKSRLSAPIGQNYEGQTFSGTYYLAYNKEKKQSFKYMFESKEYNKLKGWATQGLKDDSSYWIY